MSEKVRRLTRRDLLKVAAVSAGALALQACGSQAPAPTPQVVEKVVTQVVEKPVEKVVTQVVEKEVTQVVEKVVTATAAPAAAQQTKVHLLRWASYVPAEDEWHEKVLQEQWAKPNNVDLTIENVNPNDLQPKVTVAIETGTGADVLMLLDNWAFLYASKLTDVQEITDKMDKEGQGLYPLAKGFNQVDGVWRGVPWGMSGGAFLYREDWLKEVGETKFPETWDDMLRVGKLMREKKNVNIGQGWGHSVGDPNANAYTTAWCWGVSDVGEDGSTVTINSPKTQTYLEFMLNLFKECETPEMLGWEDTQNNRSYLGEQIWTTLNGSSIYRTSKEQFPAIAAGTKSAEVPKGPAGAFNLATSYSLVIPAYVKDPKPAREMLSWMTDWKNYQSFMEAGDGYSAGPYKIQETHPLWAKDPVIAQYGKMDAYRWPGYPGPPTRTATEIYTKYIMVDLHAKVFQGTPIPEAMSWAEQEISRIVNKG